MASETKGFQEGMHMETELDLQREDNGIKKASWKGNIKFKKWHSRKPTQNQGQYAYSYKRAQRNSTQLFTNSCDEWKMQKKQRVLKSK